MRIVDTIVIRNTKYHRGTTKLTSVVNTIVSGSQLKVFARSLISRDTDETSVSHLHVSVFPHNSNLENAQLQFDPASKNNIEFYPTSRDKIAVAHAHFIFLQTDLITNSNEFSRLYAANMATFAKFSPKVDLFGSIAVSSQYRRIIESAMLAADDRWIDHLGILVDYVHNPHFSALDLYGACLKELLHFTSSTSGIFVFGQLFSSHNPINEKDCDLDLFEEVDTEHRIVVITTPSEQEHNPIIISGIAQAHNSINPQTYISIL